MKHKKLIQFFITFIGLSLTGCEFDIQSNTGQYLEKAKIMAEEGYPGSALIELKYLLRLDSGNVPALKLFEQINYDLNDYKTNIEYLSSAITSGADDFFIYSRLIKNYLALKNYDTALEEIKRTRTLTLSERDKITLDILEARLYTKTDKLKEAGAIFDKLQDNPLSKQSGMTGRVKVTLETINKSQPENWSHLNIHLPGEHYFLQPPDYIHYLKNITVTDRQLKLELNNAIEYLQKRFQEDERNGEIASLLGKAYYFDGQFTKAIDYLNRSLVIDPGNVDSLFSLGKTNFQLGYFDAATKNLQEILRKDSQNLQNINFLAALLIHDQKIEEAVALLQPFVNQDVKDYNLLINMGNIELFNEKPQLAIPFFEEATRVVTDSAYAHALLGMAYLLAQKTQPGLEKLEQARYLDPQNLAISSALIEANLASGKNLAALRFSKTLVNEHPDSAIAYHLCGLSYLTQNKLQSAKQAFQKAIMQNKVYTPAIIKLAGIYNNEHQKQLAYDLLKQSLDSNNKDHQLLVEFAKLEEQRGHIIPARDKLLTAISSEPEFLQARILLGKNYLRSGNINEALAIEKRLKIQHRSSDSVLAYSGTMFDALGNYRNALNIFEFLVDEYPTNSRFLEQLGNVLVNSGDLHRAERVLERASLLQHNRSLSALVSLLELNLKQNRLKAAKKYLQKIKQLSPGSVEVTNLQGDILVAEKKMTAAIKNYKRSLDTRFQPEVIHKLSQTYSKNGEQDKAIKFQKGWVEKHPQDLRLSLPLIDLYIKSGNVEAALAECERVQRLQPNNLWILYRLAILYKNTDKELAYSFAKKAYEIGADSPQVYSTFYQLTASN